MIGANPLLIGGASGVAPVYESQRSVRFDGNAGFSRTPAYAGNDKIATISMWLKSEYLDDTNGYVDVFRVNHGGSNNIFTIEFDGNRLCIFAWNGSTYPLDVSTVRLFRDHTEWIHVVVRLDTTQYVPKHRCRIYINGHLETNVTNYAGSAPNYPAQYSNIYIGQATAWAKSIATVRYRGYEDDFVYADGCSYGPEKFGERRRNQWVPKDITNLYLGKRAIVNTDVVYRSQTTYFHTICKMTATRCLVAYTDENNNRYLGAASLGVSGNTLTYLNRNNNTSNAFAMEPTCLTRIDDTRAIVGWEHASSGAGSACIVTLNGDDTISFGAPVEFTSQNTNQVCMCKIDDTHILLTYVESTSYYTVARVLTISGTTITNVGATTQVSSGDAYSIGLVNIDATHCLMAYQDGGNSNRGTAVCLTISGTTVTLGTQFVFEYNSTTQVRLSKISATRYLVTYNDANTSNYPCAMILTLNGTTINCGPKKVLQNTAASYACNAVMSETQAVLCFRDNNSPFYGYAIKLLIDDYIITPVTMTTFLSDAATYVTVAAIDATRVVVACMSNDGYGHARLINTENSACGCWLKFDDASDVTAATLGKDSAYGNNWTPSGFSASTTNDGDIRKDTPTNNMATLQNIRYPLLTTQSNGNLDISGTNTFGAVSTLEIPLTGKWAMEAVVSGDAANGQYYGVCENTNDTQNSNDYNLGWMNTEDYDCCFYTGATGSGGQIYTKTGLNSPVSQQSGLGGLASGEHVRVEFDADARTVTFFREGVQIGTPQSISGLRNDRGWLFYVAGHNLVSIRVEFDVTRFNHAASSGCQSLCTKNLPAPTIEDPSLYFDVVKYPQTLRIEPEMISFNGRSTVWHSGSPTKDFLVDDDLASGAGFYTDGGGGQELVVDLGVPAKVGTIEFYPASTNVGSTHIWTAWYSDDGLNWTTTGKTLSIDTTAGWRRADIAAAIEHRYWKLVKDSNTAQSNWIGDLRICGIKDVTTTVVPFSDSALSLRFDGAARLERTPTVAGNQKTWTFSAWVKRAALGEYQWILDAFVDGNNFTKINFSNTDHIEIGNLVGGSWESNHITTAVYRDIGTWMHLLVAYDATQSTAADRVKLYINSIEVTAFDTNTDSGGANTKVNATNKHSIGRYEGTTGYYCKGYMDDICLIDGQALTPTSFGQFNANGQWRAKDLSTLAKGINGFWLKFEDINNIGTDASGNNDWIPYGFSNLAGAGNDLLADTNAVNYCTLNPLDGHGYAVITNGMLDAGSSDNAGYIVGSIGTFWVTDGSWFYESIVQAGNYGLVGWTQVDIPHQGMTAANFGPGTGPVSAGYNYSGQKFQNAIMSAYGDSFTNGDVIGVAFNATTGKIFFRKNAVWQNGGDPISGTNPAFSNLLGRAFAPCIAVQFAANIHNVNFGQRPFVYAPPTGYLPLCSTNQTVEI